MLVDPVVARDATCEFFWLTLARYVMFPGVFLLTQARRVMLNLIFLVDPAGRVMFDESCLALSIMGGGRGGGGVGQSRKRVFRRLPHPPLALCAAFRAAQALPPQLLPLKRGIIAQARYSYGASCCLETIPMLDGIKKRAMKQITFQDRNVTVYGDVYCIKTPSIRAFQRF